MKHKRKKFFRFLIFMICFLTVGGMGAMQAHASIDVDASGDKVKVRVDKDGTGTIKFILKAPKASTSTRWETVGFYITSKETNGGSTNKADYKNVLWLGESGTREDETIGSTVITTFTLNWKDYNKIIESMNLEPGTENVSLRLCLFREFFLTYWTIRQLVLYS